MFAVFALKEGLVSQQLGISTYSVNWLRYGMQAVLIFSKLLSILMLNPRKHF